MGETCKESDGAATRPFPVLSLQILCTRKLWGRVSHDSVSMRGRVSASIYKGMSE